MQGKDKKSSSYRQVWFKLIAVTLPFLFLVVLEVVLIIINYAPTPPLFVEDPNHPDHLMLNQRVALRYFQNQKLVTWGQYDLFSKEKSSRTIRIVVQGASTGVGFPYMQSLAYPKMVERWLQRAYPDFHFEVINTSIAATNSFTMLDMVDEILEVQPDLVLVYGGHNEYYGVLGAASSQRGLSSYRLNRLVLSLKHVRVIQLLKSLYASLVYRPINEEATLMANMVGSKHIPLDSKTFNQGIQQYRKNMQRMLDKYQAQQVPVIIGTLVSNEKDMPPFISSECDNRQSEGCAPTLAPDCAQAWYSLANQTSDKECKVIGYRHAKELDLLRFRAPQIFNEMIHSFESDDVLIVDLDSVFRSHCEYGVVGQELMTEHVHPNVAGYHLMATSFMKPIAETLNLDQERIAEFERRMDYNPVDSIYGSLLVQRLKANWPFVEDTQLHDPLEDYKSDDPIKQYIMYLYRGQLTWIEVVNKCYNQYLQSRDYVSAQRIAYNLVQEIPLLEEPKSMFIEAATKAGDMPGLANSLLGWGKDYYLRDAIRPFAFNVFIEAGDMDSANRVAAYETVKNRSELMHRIIEHYSNEPTHPDSLNTWRERLGNPMGPPSKDGR